MTHRRDVLAALSRDLWLVEGALTRRRCLGLLAAGLGGCCRGGGGGASGAGEVRVRVRNQTGQDFEKFWLGAGGQGPAPAPYGAIRRGSTSSYVSFEPVLARYRKYDILVAGNARHDGVVYPERYLGQPTLAPGSYTFVFTEEGGKVTLGSIVRDA